MNPRSECVRWNLRLSHLPSRFAWYFFPASQHLKHFVRQIEFVYLFCVWLCACVPVVVCEHFAEMTTTFHARTQLRACISWYVLAGICTFISDSSNFDWVLSRRGGKSTFLFGDACCAHATVDCLRLPLRIQPKWNTISPGSRWLVYLRWMRPCEYCACCLRINLNIQMHHSVVHQALNRCWLQATISMNMWKNSQRSSCNAVFGIKVQHKFSKTFPLIVHAIFALYVFIAQTSMLVCIFFEFLGQTRSTVGTEK